MSRLGPNVRKKLHLLPLPFCIALSLSAHAADEAPEDWGQCPIEDAVPVFIDRIPAADNTAQASDANAASGATEVNGDRMSGTDGQVVDLDGNVNLRRGDQVLLADRLSYDQDKETYTAEGSVRYQDRGMRLIAARAKGD